jgi:FeS assembly SUF system protein
VNQEGAGDGLTLKDFIPGGGDTVATAGNPLESGEKPADREEVVDALKSVHDPEIPVNIYDLGLIYNVDYAPAGEPDGNIRIQMTLTAPTCPVAGILPGEVARKVAAVEGVGEVTVELVWDPPWSKEMMSEEAKLALDMW